MIYVKLFNIVYSATTYEYLMQTKQLMNLLYGVKQKKMGIKRLGHTGFI